MQALSLLHSAPAIAFLVITCLWYVGRHVPRPFAIVPVAACYAMCALMLLVGGWVHRVAHVKLRGLEMDLMSRDGTPRAIVLGGAAQSGRADAGIEIPGLPPEALRIGLVGDQLKIAPGPGYERGILVRSGGKLVPLEAGGVPRLVPLQNGDKIGVPVNEGGDVIARWRLGKSRTELDVTATPRWIGGSGIGIAKLPGMAPRVIGVRLDGEALAIIKGEGFTEGLAVLVNGRKTAFAENGEARVSYRSGLTTLALAKPEPLIGTITFDESAPPLRREASLNWESALEQPLAFPFEMETGRAYRVGGTLEDDVFVKGLPGGVMTLVISADGKLTLDLTPDGKKSFESGKFAGRYPQTIAKGEAIVIGDSAAHYSGSFHLLGAAGEAEAPAAANPADTSSDEKPDAGDAESTDGDVNAPTPTTDAKRWRCAWQPAIRTHWPLPNRAISLPLVDVPVELFTRRTWTQRVFPLSQLSARESSLRSVIAYAPDHPAKINGASLLQLDPALSITRSGQSLAASPANTIGVLRKGETFEILQVLAETQGDRVASSLGHPLHPATVTDAQRVTLRRRFAKLIVVNEQRAKKDVPVLRVEFEKPMIRSLSMTDIKDELSARKEDERQSLGFFAKLKASYSDLQEAWNGAEGVSFGLNDRSGFSELPHQLTFPLLTRTFDDANADVEMRKSEVVVQDDFRRQTLDYGEPFTVGGTQRLMLAITKETVPTSRIFWVVIAGLIATAVAWVNGATFWWIALQFGVAYLTCNRVLFGQAVMVNPPFNPEVVSTAMVTLMAAPVILGLGIFLMRGLLPGRIERRLQGIESRLTWVRLCIVAFALVLLRIVLLAGLGAKEAVSLGGFRVSLSIVFVPTYLVLFAQACRLLWQEKEMAGGLLTGVVMRFAAATLWLFGCQAVTALLVSDLGMFLYFVPMALVLAAVGLCALWDGTMRSLRVSKEELRSAKPWLACVGGAGLLLPLLMMALVFTAPKALINTWPGLVEELSSDEELVTDSTLLRVLQFAQEDYLINLGTDTAERIAQDHAIMANYAHRGLLGQGYLQVDVLPAKAVTALNDNVSAVFIFAQFGVIGALMVVIAYIAVMLGALGARESVNSLTAWLALLAGMSFALVSLYMMAANYGLLPFTGRNMYLLGLNSWSDVAESFALIFLILLGIARADLRTPSVNKPQSAILGDIIEGNEA